jgi:hypothetical protein
MDAENNRDDVIAILGVLEQDWLLVDDYPEEDFLVCVNERRDVMEDFFPKKELVSDIEEEGLIEDRTKGMPSQPTTSSYWMTDKNENVEEVIMHCPQVHFYDLTEKGKELLRSNRRRKNINT